MSIVKKVKVPLRILLIVKSIDGGTGKFTDDFQKITHYFKIPVTIKTLVLEKPAFRNSYSFHPQYYAQQNFYPQKYGFSILKTFNVVKELTWLKRKIKEYSPDILFCVDSHTTILAAILKKIFLGNLVVVSNIHNNIVDTYKQKSSKLFFPFAIVLIKYALNNVNHVICVSRGLAESLQKSFNLSALPTVIYDGINTPKKIKPRTNRNNIIVSVGRLVEQKDNETLIRAFLDVAQKIPTAKLWIVGDGPEKQNLQKLTMTLGISDKVTFWGWSQNPEHLIKNADVFVLSSRREGFGYVILEAMSQGLPIISTDSPFGPREILANGKYGKLISIGNKVQTACAIINLLKNKKLYFKFSVKSVERVYKFDAKTMLYKYISTISGVIGNC